MYIIISKEKILILSNFLTSNCMILLYKLNKKKVNNKMPKMFTDSIFVVVMNNI